MSYPEHTGAVNDFANLISPADILQIQKLSQELLEKTGTSLVVVTVPDLGDSDIRSYATALYGKWGVGEKGKDKGVLILFAKKERRIRIETGYGVEGILPDGLVGQILDQYAIPWFKKGDYSEGLLACSVSVAQIIARDAGVQLTGKVALKRPSGRSSSWLIFMAPLLFFLWLFIRRGGLPVFFPPMGSGRGFEDDDFRGFGGGFGGFGGGMSGGGGADRSF